MASKKDPGYNPTEWYVKKGYIAKGKFKTPDRVPGDMVEELIAATDGGKDLIVLMLNQVYGNIQMSPLTYSSTKFLIEVITKYKQPVPAGVTINYTNASTDELLNIVKDTEGKS